MRKITSLIFLAVFMITGCASDNREVPVTEGWHQKLVLPNTYVVKKSDTLYSIAWRYGLDYRDLAILNNLDSSYHIKVGQTLRLTSAASGVKAKVPAQIQQKQIVSANNSNINWIWPVASHQVINNFSVAGLNKGIDIAGKAGSPVLAAAAGKVVYSGNGLRGYGNLLIIKHNAEFLSAYAHNQKLLVHDGQSVQASQVIAKMGNTEAKQVMLHFEIRKAGKPVDPLKYLPAN